MCPTLLKSIQNENNKNIYITSILYLYDLYITSILSLYYLYITSILSSFCFQLTLPTIATNIALFLHIGQGAQHFWNRFKTKIMKIFILLQSYLYIILMLPLSYLYVIYWSYLCFFFCFQLTPPNIATNIALFLHTGQCGPKHFLNVQTKRFNRLRIKVMKKAKEECRGKNKGYPTLLKSIQNENNKNLYITSISSIYFFILPLYYLHLCSNLFRQLLLLILHCFSIHANLPNTFEIDSKRK